MSSDSDEPLSVLKEKIPKAICAVSRKAKKRLKKRKNAELQNSESNELLPKTRYPSSQAPEDRPHDVWLYLKDLNRIGPYSCLLCTEWFIHRSKLVIHYVLNHKKDYCGICRYFVEDREAWIKHCEFHRPVVCSQCTLHLDSDTALRAHSIEEHKALHCRLCCFLVQEDQYNNHLFKKHIVTNVSNKDCPVLWETEYEGSPQFSCLLCIESLTPFVDFYKHYIYKHRLTLKCFSMMLSGFDVPFTVYGTAISNEVLESNLKNHEKLGYVATDCNAPNLDEQVNSNINFLDIKQEVVSDSEDKLEVAVSPNLAGCQDEDVTPSKKNKFVGNDPILSYKGTEDFDITLAELIIMDISYYDYVKIHLSESESRILPVEYEITQRIIKEQFEINCSLCDEVSPTVEDFTMHMVKKHCMKTVPSHFCRLCLTTFDLESDLKTHCSEEMEEFKNLWICQFCDREFQNRNDTRLHLNEHRDELTMENCFSPHLGFKCRYCFTLFWREGDRELHHRRVHFEKGKLNFYNCNKCEESFSDKIWFVYHYIHAHGFTSHYMVKCCVCCLVLPDVFAIKEHFLEQHPEAKKIFCSLGVCKYKPFSQSKSFKTHILTTHGRNARSQLAAACTVCGREFANARSLGSHMSLAHGSARFKCKICSENFQTDDERKLHLMVMHPGDRPFACNLCDKSFRHKSSLYMHRATHTRKETFTCEYCSKQFNKKDSYRDHKLIHTGPRHACSYCPMLFVQRSNMLRHERRHTGERPYTCRFCGRSFSDKGACTSHMRIHVPHDSFACPFCGVTFVQKTKLSYHMRRHTGEGLETCPVCSKLFTTAYALRAHMETHDKGAKKTDVGEGVECEHCDRKYKSKSHLTRHQRLFHSAGGALACPLCEVKVATSALLRYHVRSHGAIKHIKCKFCFKHFSTSRSIRKHLVNMHNIQAKNEALKQLYTELDPRECGLQLDEPTIRRIFGPKVRKERDTDVLLTDFVTLSDFPLKKDNDDTVDDNGDDDDIGDDEFDEEDSEDNINDSEENLDVKYDVEVVNNTKGSVSTAIKEIKKESKTKHKKSGKYSETTVGGISVKIEPCDDETDSNSD